MSFFKKLFGEKSTEPGKPSGKYIQMQSMLGRKIEITWWFSDDGSLTGVSVVNPNTLNAVANKKEYTWHMDGNQVVISGGSGDRIFRFQGSDLVEIGTDERLTKSWLI